MRTINRARNRYAGRNSQPCVNQSHALIEMLTDELAGAMVNHLKSICQNDYEALLGTAKEFSDVVRSENKLNRASPDIVKATALINISLVISKQSRAPG